MLISPTRGDGGGHLPFGSVRTICVVETVEPMGGTIARDAMYGADDPAGDRRALRKRIPPRGRFGRLRAVDIRRTDGPDAVVHLDPHLVGNHDVAVARQSGGIEILKILDAGERRLALARSWP